MLNYELSELIEKIIDIKAKTSTVEIKSAHNGCPKRLYDTLSSFF
jgi:ATP-dependent DNA helicase RecG